MNGNLLNRDFSLKALLILGTLAAAAALAGGMGLRFPPGDAAKPLAMAGTLAGAAAFYCRVRKVPGFAQAATAIAQLVLFSACYAVLMYALAGAARPLVDDTLVRADRLLGLETPDAMAWAAAHPAAGRCLGLAYNTVLPQTALAVAALGFLGDRRRLEAFVLRFMLAALLTAALFWLWPAEGPFSAYGYAPSPSQARYLEHLRAMRGGGMTTVTWRGAEGLISFPSFHTAWAILLTLSVRRRPAAFAAAACLNAAVVAATLTTGWHYASDALGGALVCAVAVALARLLGGGADDPGAFLRADRPVAGAAAQASGAADAPEGTGCGGGTSAPPAAAPRAKRPGGLAVVLRGPLCLGEDAAAAPALQDHAAAVVDAARHPVALGPAPVHRVHVVLAAAAPERELRQRLPGHPPAVGAAASPARGLVGGPVAPGAPEQEPGHVPLGRPAAIPAGGEARRLARLGLFALGRSKYGAQPFPTPKGGGAAAPEGAFLPVFPHAGL